MIWSPHASHNLSQVVDYLEKEWNDAVLRDFFARLEGLIERIQIFPTIGRASASRRNIRLIVFEPYHQVVYQYFPRKNVIAFYSFGTPGRARKSGKVNVRMVRIEAFWFVYNSEKSVRRKNLA